VRTARVFVAARRQASTVRANRAAVSMWVSSSSAARPHSHGMVSPAIRRSAGHRMRAPQSHLMSTITRALTLISTPLHPRQHFVRVYWNNFQIHKKR
jgi:hypothetical protein